MHRPLRHLLSGLLALAAMLVALLPVGAFAGGTTLPKTLNVPTATASWLGTGLSPAKGIQIAIKATGSGMYCGSDPSCTAPTPAGDPDQGSICNGGYDGVPTACIALVGRWGSGPGFVIGAKASLKAPGGQQLQLGIHDWKFDDNSGSYRVTIKKLTLFKVSGTVRTKDCSGPGSCAIKPLAGATVTAAGKEMTASATTKTDGSWSVKVAKGSYTITPVFEARPMAPTTRQLAVSGDVGGLEFLTCGPKGPLPAAAPATAPTCPTLQLDWRVPPRFPTPAGSIAGQDGLPTAGYVDPDEWPVTLFITAAGGRERSDCAERRFTWKLKPIGGGATITRRGPDGACDLDTTVPSEGAYAVTVSEAKRRSDGTWAATGRIGKQTVTIQDWLILAMGDSLASGEGNPDEPKPSVAWQFAQCHRSLASYQARAAAIIEREDRHTSVTFVHAACSGADLSNLIGRDYVGIEPGAPLDSQLDQIRQRLDGTGREVDAVFLSAGINDLRFGTIISLCVQTISEFCPELTVVETTDPNGVPTLETNSAAGLTLARFAKRRTSTATTSGALGGRYADLDAALGGVAPKRVIMPAYPDPGTNQIGETCHPGDPGNPTEWKTISPHEAEWLRNTGRALNDAAGVAAGRYGWTFLAAMETVYVEHGWCSTKTWIQSVSGSFAVQGNKEGAMHPIGRGVVVTAEAVAGAACRQFYRGSKGDCSPDPIKDPDAIRRPGKGSRL